jgi:hypothetical protein
MIHLKHFDAELDWNFKPSNMEFILDICQLYGDFSLDTHQSHRDFNLDTWPVRRDFNLDICPSQGLQS